MQRLCREKKKLSVWVDYLIFDMRPRNKAEREVMRLHGSLPPISQAQKEWAYRNCFDAIGYINNGLVWCTLCGCEFEEKISNLSVSIKIGDKVVCPYCGKELELKVSKKKKLAETEYFTVMTTKGGFQVFRHYIIDKYMYRVSKYLHTCQDPSYYITEVVQNWLDKDGKDYVVARPRKGVFGYRYDNWDYRKPMSIKERSVGGYNPDIYNINSYYIYPRKKVLPVFKRNGYRGYEPIRFSTMDLFKMILRSTEAETLLKAGQYGFLELMNKRGGLPYWHAIRIVIRNGYRMGQEDAQLWLDMVGALDYLGKDTHNAHYVCPENLKEAHDEWIRRKERKESRIREDVKRKQVLFWKDEYVKKHERFFGLSFSNGEIVIEPIKSVPEMQEEADYMRHCVMKMGYYKKEKSLIMSAKDSSRKRLETIEVNLENMKVVQSFGRFNEITPQHERILELVNRNMNKIAELV